MGTIIKVGQWAVAERILKSAPGRLKRALDIATQQEAHYLRRLIVIGLREQNPGGKPFQELSPITLALRKFSGFGGTKALLVRGDMRNSITVTKLGSGAAFVGILRTAKGRDGQSLANVAEINEYGKTIVIRLTQRMREFLAMALKGKSAGGGGGGGGGTGVIVVRIPPRPFIGPIIEKYFQPEDVRMRFLARVGRLLNGDFGQVGIPIPMAGGSGTVPGAQGGASTGGGGGGGGSTPRPPRNKDPRRIAAAKLGWTRRRQKGS